ncbi:MAG: PepSY-associated TM helix domain-containing protein [Asticcacaulis sp.]|uniref:PepSY-associated TM helix domain-containing protein n=1 Tax=Asticcacaulis sp. TaxID=1872648 RepID=UPI0039E5DB6A
MTKSRTLWPKVSAAFVAQNLTGHKILGLATAAVLYLICLSGTATVFYIDMERWETARNPEITEFRPEIVAAAIADARPRLPKGETTINLYTPTKDYPRLNVQVGKETRTYDAQGHYAGSGKHPATEALTELHYYLHLPSSFGMIVVSIGGVAMLALILGGLLAHPRILKDAFLWRLNGTPRTNRADLHNRIGVWASPFHIVIALTGAVIGLSQIFLFVSAMTFNKGDTTAAFAPVYPDIAAKTHDGQMSTEAIIKALTTLRTQHPDAHPNYIGLNNIGTDHEALSVAAEVDDRLVYGDNWEFDGKGNLVGRLHLSDGAAGKQVFASLYRLHFGNFGGIWVRWAYVLLGLGLCLICTTGMDIWLMKSAQKGRPYPRLHKLWTGFVWGSAAAMALATLTTITAGLPYIPVFWGLTLVLSLSGLCLPSQGQVSRIGRYALAASLLALVAGHVLRFGATSFSQTALGLNLTLLVLAAITAGLTLWQDRRQG